MLTFLPTVSIQNWTQWHANLRIPTTGPIDKACRLDQDKGWGRNFKTSKTGLHQVSQKSISEWEKVIKFICFTRVSLPILVLPNSVFKSIGSLYDSESGNEEEEGELRKKKRRMRRREGWVLINRQ